MADYYVKSGASGAADGSTWADAYTTLAAAFAAGSAGDRFFVSDNHAETQASNMSLTSPGTAAAPCLVLCVDDSAEPPTALATTATVSTTGATNIAFNGYVYFYGITFSGGSGGSGNQTISVHNNSSATFWGRFDSCVLKTGQTADTSRMGFGVSSGGGERASLVELINTQLQFGHASQKVALAHSTVVWRNTVASFGTVPTVRLFEPSTGVPSRILIEDVDLSALGSGPIFSASVQSITSARLSNCKLGSGAVIATGSIVGQGGFEVEAVNCDSADTNYAYYRQNYQGVVTQETTIVRSGGATDGTTPISRKMVSSANASLVGPLELGPLLVPPSALAAGVEATVTVEVVTDNVTLTDAEAWIEVEYLGTSGFPLALRASDRAAASTAFLGTPSNQPTSSETWTTTGLTTPVKQYLSVTFTPAEDGVAYVRVYLAKASTTMYVCPLPDVT